MDNVLDILCDYSFKGKEVDYNFLKYVFEILKDGNEECIERIGKKKYSNKSKKASYVPMAYYYFNKKIYIYPDQVNKIRYFLNMSTNGEWSELERIFLYNTQLLFDLLHEFEHVDQFGKLLHPDFSLESKLLRLTYFAYTEIFKEGKFSQFLINNFGLYLNDDLADHYLKQDNYNKSFGSDVIHERLANIYASQKINNLLNKIDNIDKVKDFFAISGVQYLLDGYNDDYLIPFPTIRYLKDVESLEIPELNEYIYNVVLPDIVDVTDVTDRLKYGLYVTEKEKTDLKKMLI